MRERGLEFKVGLLILIVLIVLFKRTPVQDIPLGVPVGRLVAHKNGGAGNGNAD